VTLHPLFVVTGASGAGKSTIRAGLVSLLPDFAVLDLDPYIERFKDAPTPVHPEILRDAAAAGKPVVLCGACIPENLEPLHERRRFGQIHYLALVCEDHEIDERLKARPGWETWGSQTYLTYHWNFNHWIKTHAAVTSPPMRLLSTTGRSPDETLGEIHAWIRSAWR